MIPESISPERREWALKRGTDLVSDEVFQQRAAQCQAPCPHWNGSECTLCGCGWSHLMIASKSCPDDPPRWEAVK